jgi:hypothetical protein
MAFFGKPYHPEWRSMEIPTALHLFYLTHARPCALPHPCMHMCSISPIRAHACHLTHACTCISSHPCMHTCFISPIRARVFHPCLHMCLILPKRAHARTCLTLIAYVMFYLTHACTCVSSHPCVHMCARASSNALCTCWHRIMCQFLL